MKRIYYPIMQCGFGTIESGVPQTSITYTLSRNRGYLTKDNLGKWWFTKNDIKIELFPFQVRTILEIEGYNRGL